MAPGPSRSADRPATVREMHVLVIGAYSPLFDRLWAAGAQTSWLCDPAGVAAGRGAAEHLSVTVSRDRSVSGRSALAVQAALAGGATHVVATDDASMLVAALAREALEVGGGESSAVVRRVHDKAELRRVMARAVAADPVGWRRCAVVRHARVRSAQEAIAFGDACGWPIVLKPTSGTGSAGVSLDVTPGTAAQAHSRAAARTPENPDGEVLAEETLQGVLLTVDTLTFRGVHTVTSVGFELTAAAAPVVTCAGTPAPIAAATREGVVDVVFRALTALGVRAGPAHSEVLLQPDGSVALVETQLRPGGDVPEATFAATGLDVYTSWIDLIRGAEPLLAAPDVTSLDAAPAVVVWGAPEVHGTCLEIRSLPDTSADGLSMSRVMTQPPFRSRPVRDRGDSSVGILCRGRTVDEALGNALRLLGRVRHRVRLDVFAPADTGPIRSLPLTTELRGDPP